MEELTDLSIPPEEPGPQEGSPLEKLVEKCREAEANPTAQAPDNPAQDLETKAEALAGQQKMSVFLRVFNVTWK
jgi:hypothetical protein